MSAAGDIPPHPSPYPGSSLEERLAEAERLLARGADHDEVVRLRADLNALRCEVRDDRDDGREARGELRRLLIGFALTLAGSFLVAALAVWLQPP